MVISYSHMSKKTLLPRILVLFLLSFRFPLVTSYLLLVSEDQLPGDVLFNASVYKLGSERNYHINTKRSAPFVTSLISVDSRNGEVVLLEQLRCDGIFYPGLFTLYIDSISNRLRDIDYYSLPLRIFVTGRDCTSNSRQYANIEERKRRRRDVLSNVTSTLRARVSEARQWIAETYASFSIPTADKWRKICVRKSQFINSIAAFLPKTVSQFCTVNYLDLNDDRFKIERSQGDLVASRDVCILESLWKVTVTYAVHCHDVQLVDAEHRLKIVYHHQEFNDTEIARRIRRELRNQSPFFEQHLYVASVLEECDPGMVVTTVKARDPENSPITYFMTSLLDSRTQAMFEIDTKTGVITTRVKLDRELVDVHYFRVTAVDDSFPPRSGTTMLQINVLDGNDHSPVFEMNEYEASVREGVSVGTTVITLKATDQDVGKNAEVEYAIRSISGGGMSSDEEDSRAFKIDSRSGVISTRTLLDRETTQVYTIIVEAADLAPESERRSATATVIVRILDDNDNYPQFSERTYTVSMNEDIDWSANPVVAHIKAHDADEGNNAAIRYAIIGGNTQSQFTIDSLSGDVSLVKPLDYETIRSYRLVIRAQDGGSPARSNTTQLLVNVKDVNDNAPRFYTSLFQESVTESVVTGYSIVKVQAYDADEGPNADIKYTIAPRDAAGSSTDALPLAVDAQSGWIYTTKELDREEQSKYMFQVVASDQGSPPHSASASVIITVQDINDNNPVFESKVYESVICEDAAPGTPVATVTASDADEDNRLHYELINGNVRGRFAITSHNGKGLITVAQPLDYKQEKRYILTATATDSGGRSDTATIYVNITDANNFAPAFQNAPYSAGVFEDAPVGTTVLVVAATDNDVGQNAQITYALGDDSDAQQPHEFTINAQTGAIITAKQLDRETVSGYLLTVTARDGGVPSLSDTTDVEIAVNDVNDNFPVFKQPMYAGSVLEDALVGTSVVQVSATDADVGLNGRIRYTLSERDVEDGSFVIDPTSGVIRTNKGLDRESVALYELEAYAIDRGSPSLSSSVPVNIRIEDVNDNPPAFDSDKIVLYIAENSPIGSTVGEIHAKDPDEGVNAIVQYSIIGGDDAQSFSLVTRPGSEKAELLTMTELDYESARKKFDLVIRAASPPLRSDVHVEIVVTDVNDNAPALKDFQVVFNNFRDFFPTGPVGRIPAFDADVSDRLQYKILSGNNANLVALNESTGQLELSPQLNTNVPKLASMEVSVTDGINEVKAIMQLSVRLITEEMLLSSITVRLNQMTKEAFLSPLLSYFIDGLAAIIPCPKENIYLFSIQDDTDVNGQILNVSFSAKRPDVPKEQFYSPQFLQERVYLNRAILARLSTVQVLPFDDNLCVTEPCLNYEECLTVLKFGNASTFISSDTVLFRPIYPVTTFTCRCAPGFTGSREHYLCDTEVNLCYSSPCKNGGTCNVRESGYTCICPPDYTGVNCELSLNSGMCKPDVCHSGFTCTSKTDGFKCEQCVPEAGPEHYTAVCELRSRSFRKNTFLTFPSLRQRHRFTLQLRFATLSRDGLLLYNGRYNEQHDFVALEIVDGALQFSFSLGQTTTKVTASIPKGVSDGEWHTVTISYFNKTATLSIDNCDTELARRYGEQLGGRWACAQYVEHQLEARCASLTETCYRFLDLTGPLQLGGLPAIPAVFQPRNHHYEGCIADLHIDHRFIDLNSYVTDNGTSAGCPEKRLSCDSYPCRNGGKCAEGWGTFKCDCAAGFGGRDCSDVIGQPWRFAGDGMLSFNPLLRPIQLPWLNALSIRTLQTDTFLMSIQVGQNSSAVVSLKHGFLLYAYNNEQVNLTSKLLADGRWHRVEVTWLGTEIRLAIDYGETQMVAPFAAKIQGLYVGKILIGGPDNTYSSLNAGYNYLEGCIEDVRIGTQQTALSRPTVKENVLDGCEPLTECQTECPAASECVVAWGDSHCECHAGHVGALCVPVCDVSPCRASGVCAADTGTARGYHCTCNSSEYSGAYCEHMVSQPCPASWWGYPVCGPCDCDTAAGYNPDCNKKTGQCYCKENYYRPPRSIACLPCNCYMTGSYSAQCDAQTGQCRCREGVIGQRCDACPNPYAEITLDGCEVIYDGCPRSAASEIWWPRTNFGQSAVESCPRGALGMAMRSCDNLLGGWQRPDLFNCTSHRFGELRNQLALLERGELQLNTFVAIRLAAELYKATNATQDLYGADVLITFEIVEELIAYEGRVSGLNLTHSQDKDYISNLVHAVNVVLAERYGTHWNRIRDLMGYGGEHLVATIEKYINILSSSQHDTYTQPFEIVSPQIALGLDIVTPESLFGYETEPPPALGNNDIGTETVVLPDTSQFLEQQSQGALVTFPKYNNYLLDAHKFDLHSKIYVPLKLLEIKPPREGELTTKHSLSASKAVISYVQYKEAGLLFPNAFDDSVLRRWGVDLIVGSPLMSVSILIPEYVKPTSKVTKVPARIAFEPPKPLDETEKIKLLKKTLVQAERKPHENDPQYYKLEGHRMKRDETSTRKLMYRSLAGVSLQPPLKMQLWLHSNRTIFNERSNPQCVHWSMARGFGEWSRVGCRTEVEENWHQQTDDDAALLVNCSCSHLSTFAVLVDVVDLEYIPEPSLLENISSYSCFGLSLPLLLATYLILALIRGVQTNSNTIRRNLVLCVFLGEVLYFISLKARRPTVSSEFVCKLLAMGLHYLWLGAFSWTFIDAIHLYRMLTEMRDINHGPMRFYYTIGYVLPAVVVSLAVGVRAHQYGNYYFCWVSLYESVVWSVVGPVCLLVFFNILVLIVAIRAAFTLQDHVLGFGNLRTLLWVSVVALPLLGATWVLALLTASEKYPLLTPLLSLMVLIHAAFALGGYCFANRRVRENVIRSLMRCVGKKVPLLEGGSTTGVISTSSHNISGQSRSALTYRSGGFDSNRRNIGISTSSTTSRSTTKTSSSPYRSDTQLRQTSTSTSNYNSNSDVPSYLRGFENETTLHHHHQHHKIVEEEERRVRRPDSDSDSDGSEGRSLELASSHSSDDDESSTKRHRSRPARQGYLPNITEHVVSRCGTPPALNIVTNSQLFPAVQSAYAPRWSSQLPESYLPNTNGDGMGRWSAETASDNEFFHKTSSPNPLPNPDVTPDAALHVEQYVERVHYDPHYITNTDEKPYMNKMLKNFHDYAEQLSDIDDKHQIHEKYLFPYTAEEDHLSHSCVHSSRMMPPAINDINNPNLDYPMGGRMGSRMGSVLGSVHGSVCGSVRGSPSATMMHSNHLGDSAQLEDANEETSV